MATKEEKTKPITVKTLQDLKARLAHMKKAMVGIKAELTQRESIHTAASNDIKSLKKQARQDYKDLAKKTKGKTKPNEEDNQDGNGNVKKENANAEIC